MPPFAGIEALFVGHAQHTTAQTGCTVVLYPNGATVGVDVRGAAPGTRETDLCRPGTLVEQAQAVLLSGGSAFGLAAADGVVRWLWERGHGFSTAVVPVPIVPAAVLFDLQPDAVAWPDATIGYAACEAAMHDAPHWGMVGAGTGATVGKVLGPQAASPGGVGMAALRLGDGTIVAAVVAVNAVGHVVDPASGNIVAGPRLPDGGFGDAEALLLGAALPPGEPQAGANTTIGCVVTNARLDKAGCCRVASMAHDGLARVIRPVHTQYDGDTLFTLAAPPADAPPADITMIGVAAAQVAAEAVLHAVRPDARP